MAELFTWDPSKLSVHVDSMDKEHIKLIGIMNKLYDKHNAKAPKAELKKILMELATFTTEHFAHEEAYFDKLPNYSKSQSHKLIHKELLKRVGVFIADFEAKGVITEDFFRFLKVWLTSHIAGIDVGYGQAAGKKTA